MTRWNSRGLRGSGFEEEINFANEWYKKEKLAIIQKIATPITPVNINPQNGNITLAFFEKDSTVDYIGVAQGVPICFDAKETAKKNLPLSNIHDHQIEFMIDFQEQNGLSFILVNFTSLDEYFLLPLSTVLEFKKNAISNNGRKSIPYESFDENLKIMKNGSGFVNYLDAVSKYLQMVDNNIV